MFAAIRQIFLKGGDIKDAIAYVFKATGNMPTKSEGMRIINMYQDVQKNTGKVIEFPKDRITPFYKPRPGEGVANTKQKIFKIDDELEKISAGEGKYAKMSRNEREDLMIKLQDESSTLQDKTLFKDSPEAIAKIKADNKAAVERLKAKKKTVEDFSDDGDFDPGGMASGGLARVGMFGGGPAVAKKIWQEFIEKLFIKSSNDIRLGKGKWAGLSQDQWIKQHDDLTKMLKKWEMSGKKGLPEGAEQYLGMNNLQITKAIKDAEKKVLSKPKKTLEGIKKEGTIDISDPEVADEFTTFIKESDPEGFKDIEQKIEIGGFDVTGRKKNASGGIAGQLHLNEGGRVPMIYGGSPGLRMILKKIKKMVHGDKKGKRLFPKDLETTKLMELGEKIDPRAVQVFKEQDTEFKAEGLARIIKALEGDKKLLQQIEKNRTMGDSNLNFLMDQMGESMVPHIKYHKKGVKGIDKDILDLEMIRKKMLTKDRKLNAEGGLANILGV